MIGNQESAYKQNAAWRAFWIKIRELNARETDRCREEIGEQDELASAVVLASAVMTEEGGALYVTASDEKHH